MKTLLIAALAWSVSSSPYELVQFENADFRDWTREEMRSRLGIGEQELERYACDGVSEYALLQPFPSSNDQGTSLSVRLSPGGSIALYASGELWNEQGRRVRAPVGSFGRETLDALRVLERTPSGSSLIERIRHSPYPILIDRGGPRFGPMNDAGAVFRGLDMAQALQSLVTLRKPDYPSIQFDRIGTGGVLFHNPALSLKSWESDGVQRAIRPEIVIAHEMYHAYDSIRGALDRRFVSGVGYESLEVAEFRAVRFENTIRKELGLLYRSHYAGSPGEAGVLNSEGLPLSLPAPCLTSE